MTRDPEPCTECNKPAEGECPYCGKFVCEDCWEHHWCNVRRHKQHGLWLRMKGEVNDESYREE